MDTGASSSIGWGTGVDDTPAPASSSSSRPVANGLPNGHRPPSSARSAPRDHPPNGTTNRRSNSRRGDMDWPAPLNGDAHPRGDYRPPYDDRPPSNYHDYPARYPPYEARPSSYHQHDYRPPYTDGYNYGAYPPRDSSSYQPRPAYDHHDHHAYPPSGYPPYDHHRPFGDRPPTSSYYDSRPPPSHHYDGGYPPPPPQPTRPSVAHTYRDPTAVIRDTSNIILVPGFEGGFADEVSPQQPSASDAPDYTATTSVTAPSPSPIAPSLTPGAPLLPNPSSPHRNNTNNANTSNNSNKASGSRRSHRSYNRSSRRGMKSERRSHTQATSSTSHHVDSRSRTSASPSRSHRRRDRDETLGFPRFNGQLPRRGGARPFVQVAVGDVEELRRMVLSSQPTGCLPAESTHTILYGRYKLMGALGKGVSSIVIKAEDLAWAGDGPEGPTSDLTSFEHRYVAIKVFRGSKTYDTACGEEAALLELVSSVPSSSSPSGSPAAQYVLPLLRHIPHPSHAALVFPVAGPTLFHYLQRSLLHAVGLPVSDVIAVLHQLLTSLAHMHSRGVVHADLKPENIVVVLPPFVSEDGSGKVVVYEGGPLPMQRLTVCGPKAEEQVAARLRVESTHLENDIKSQGGDDNDKHRDGETVPLMGELGQGWSEDSYHDQSPKASYKLCQELLESHAAGTGISFHIPRFVPNAGVPRCEVRVIDLGNSRTGGCDASGAGPRRRRRVEHSPIASKKDGDCVEASGGALPPAAKKIMELSDPHQLVRSAVPWFPAYPSCVIQTSHYRAPEVMLGADWDARVDVWSVGCLVTELLSGVELFHSCESDVDHLALIEHVLTHNKNDSKAEAVRIFPSSFYNRDTCLDYSKFFSGRHGGSSEDGSKLRLRDPMRESQRTLYPSLSERFSERASWSYRTPSNTTSDEAAADEVANDQSGLGNSKNREGDDHLDIDHPKLKLLFGLTRSLLNVDPTSRLTASEALNHPVFADL